MRKYGINNLRGHGLKPGSSPGAGMDVGGHLVGGSIPSPLNLLRKNKP